MFRPTLIALLAGLILLPANGASAAEGEEKPPAQTAANFGRETCRSIEDEAARNGLPASFFARLIWRESLFNPKAVSPRGAQGIAQFMPGTASERGLDPFDSTRALAESAKYLTELRRRFGSLGLAAAAYNAGPGRVTAWRKGGTVLPGETQDYVIWITGHSAEDWSAAKKPLGVLPIADDMSFATACRKLAARGLTAKLPPPSLRRSGWQALFAAGLGITQIKASKPGRTRVVIDLNHAQKSKASLSKPK